MASGILIWLMLDCPDSMVFSLLGIIILKHLNLGYQFTAYAKDWWSKLSFALSDLHPPEHAARWWSNLALFVIPKQTSFPFSLSDLCILFVLWRDEIGIIVVLFVLWQDKIGIIRIILCWFRQRPGRASWVDFVSLCLEPVWLKTTRGICILVLPDYSA